MSRIDASTTGRTMDIQSNTTNTKHAHKAVLWLAADAAMADRIVTSLKA